MEEFGEKVEAKSKKRGFVQEVLRLLVTTGVFTIAAMSVMQNVNAAVAADLAEAAVKAVKESADKAAAQAAIAKLVKTGGPAAVSAFLEMLKENPFLLT